MTEVATRIMKEKLKGLDDRTAGVLKTIVQRKVVTRKELADMYGHDSTDKAAFTLIGRGLIDLDTDGYKYSAAEHLAGDLAEVFPEG